MSDPSWLRNCDALVDALRRLDKVTQAAKRATQRVVVAKDITKEKTKIKKINEEARGDVLLIHDAMVLLEKFMRLSPVQYATQGTKLTADAQSTVRSFQDAIAGFYKRCSLIEQQHRDEKPTNGGSSKRRAVSRSGLQGSQLDDDDDDNQDENVELLDKSGGVSNRGKGAVAATALTTKEEFEKQLHDEIMRDRASELKEIAENVRDINEIFHHIHDLVGEQGAALEVVDEQTDAALQSTKNATEQLRQAAKASDQSRRQQVCLLFAFFIVLAVIVAVLSA